MPWNESSRPDKTELAALRPGGAAAGGGEIVLMAADDVGDHVAHLRVLEAPGLLERRELILQARLELAGDSALLKDQLGAPALALLDLLRNALEPRGQLFGVLGHQVAELFGAARVRHARCKDCRPDQQT